MKARLWRGFHSRELLDLLRRTWVQEECLILIPPILKDFSFLGLFADVEFYGDWPDEFRKQALTQPRVTVDNPQVLQGAVLGLFTSGTSTGAPRLIFYSRQNVEASLDSIRELYQVPRIGKIFVYPQPTHTFGLVLGYLQALLFDLSLEFHPGPYGRKAHEHWLATVDENTLTLGTPTHFIDLLQFVKTQGLRPRASYSAIVGGARATQELWHSLRQVLNIEAPSIGYGATEASPGVTHLPPGVPPRDDGDIGFALRGVKIELVPGEGLRFSGPNLCMAIYEIGRLRAAENILLRDALQIEPGEAKPRYSFFGRTDLLLNRGGQKLSLEMIEGKISSQLGIKCLAIAVFDERLGEDVALLLPPQQKEMQEQVRKLLRDHFLLNLAEESIFWTEIPLNANGKFDRLESMKRFLMRKKWQFPVAIAHLKSFMPHRGSAIWMDTLLSTDKNGGVGQVLLRETSRCFSAHRVRESSCIEWAAQTYGYAVTMGNLLGLVSTSQVSRVFIAEVKNCSFHFGNEDLRPGDELHVDVRCTHDFGNLKVVHGKVLHQEKLLAEMDLKLYCS